MTLATQNISFNAVASGTGNFAVSSAYTILTPEQARVVNGKTYSYYAQSLDETQWESGSGAYTVSTHTLARTTIVATSNGNLSPVNFTLPPVVGMSGSPSPSLELADMFKSDNLAGLANPIASRVNIYAAPFDALAYNGMQLNGTLQVSQERGATAFSLPISTTTYAQDGFQIFQSFATSGITAFPLSAIGTLSISTQFLSLIVATGTTPLTTSQQVFIDQKIEGTRTFRLGWGRAGAQPISIGFFVFTTIPGTMAVSVYNGAANRCYTTDVVINAGNTWEYKTVTIPGDTTGTWATDNTTGLWIRWCFGTGPTFQGTPNVWGTSPFSGTTSTTNFVATTSNNIAITGVLVLPGIETPTQAQAPLIQRTYEPELLLCRRHWEPMALTRVGSFGTSYAGGTWPWRVQKRVSAPTLSYSDAALTPSKITTAAGGNGQTFTAGGLATDSQVLYLDGIYSGALGNWISLNVVGDARL